MLWGNRLWQELAAVKKTAELALEQARDARAEHDAHTVLCTERWGELRRAIDMMMASQSKTDTQFREAIGRLFWMWIGVGGAMITGMSGLVVTLLIKVS